MEGILEQPPTSTVNSAIMGSERGHMLDEALGLVVSHIMDPLLDPTFGEALLGSLVVNDSDREALLKDIWHGFRESFVVCE